MYRSSSVPWFLLIAQQRKTFSATLYILTPCIVLQGSASFHPTLWDNTPHHHHHQQSQIDQQGGHQVATGAVRVVEESLSQSPESKLPISSNTPVDTHPLKLLLHVGESYIQKKYLLRALVYWILCNLNLWKSLCHGTIIKYVIILSRLFECSN